MKVILDEVCERESSNLKQSDVINNNGDYPIYGAAGYIGNVDFYHQGNPYIAVVKDGAGIGRATLLPAYSSVIGTMQYLIPKSNVLPEYLYYVIRNMHLEKYYTGATIPHIYFKDYKKETFNLSSIEEQRKIVDILGKVERIIEARTLEMEQFNILIRARFVEMFGNVDTGNYRYKTYKLGDVASVGSSHRVFTTEFVEKGVPFYRGTEIGELANGIKPTEPYFISKEQYNRLANDDTKPQIGDLLMPSICNKGQVWMVDTKEPFYYKDGRVLCISPDREIFDTKYLEYFMRVKTLVTYPKLGSGSTFAEFKIFLLKGIDVLVPPRNLQEQFADFVRQVDKSKIVGFLKRTTDTEMYMSKFDSIL